MTFGIITPHTRGAGYFYNDDRPSGGRMAEADVRTCPHCQAIIKMAEWDVLKDKGGFCTKCCAPLCQHCGRRMVLFGCTPFMKQLDQLVEMQHTYREFLELAGMGPPGPPPQPIYTGHLNQQE